MEDLLEKVIAISESFRQAEIPHSFGGAIALGYYGYVRGTGDIDINVYLAVDAARPALDSLYELGVLTASEKQLTQIRRSGQTRLFWDEVPLDLFFWNMDFHASCCERRRHYALLEHTIDVLSPEDLVVRKVAFARAKDSHDIQQMLDAMGDRLDVAYVLSWVERIVGEDAASARDLIDALVQRGLMPET